MKLGKVLEAYRKASGATYRSLAKEINIDHSVLFRVISGKPCDIETWSLIYAWLTTK